MYCDHHDNHINLFMPFNIHGCIFSSNMYVITTYNNHILSQACMTISTIFIIGNDDVI